MYNTPTSMPPAQKKSGVAAYVPYFFLVGAVVGAIGCLGRADYNLPVFLFAYIAWSYLRVTSVNRQSHKYIVMVVFVYSLIIDALWFVFIYLIIINSDDYDSLAPWERGIQKCSCIVMIINFFIKVLSCNQIIAIAISFFFEPEVRTQMNTGPQSPMGAQIR